MALRKSGRHTPISAPAVRLLGGILIFAALASVRVAAMETGPTPGEDWGDRARSLIGSGDYEKAAAFLGDRLAAAPEDREKLEMLRCRGDALWYAGRNGEAALSFGRALELARALNLGEEAVSVEMVLASQRDSLQAQQLFAKGDLAGSNAAYEKALGEARTARSRAHELRVLFSWSVNYMPLPGSLGKYLDLNVRALELALALGHRVEASRAALNIGTYYTMKSDYSRALSFYFSSLHHLRGRTAGGDAIKCLNNIGSVYQLLGDYTKAQDYVQEAVGMAVPGSPEIMRDMLPLNLAQIFQSLGRRLKSREYSMRALECIESYLKLQGGPARNPEPDVLAIKAGVYLDLGRLDDAQESLREAEAAARSRDDRALSATFMMNLAELLFRNGDISGAERAYRTVLSGAEESGDFLQKIMAACGLGRCAESRGDDGQAVVFYDQAVRAIGSEGPVIVKDTDRAVFINRAREPYEALIETYYRLFRKNHLPAFEREIFRVSETFRARSFMEFLERRDRLQAARPESPRSAADSELSGERLALLKRLSRGVADKTESEAVQSRIRHLDDMLEEQVFAEQMKAGGRTTLFAPAPLSVLRDSARAGRIALVEYFLGDERSFLFCVTGDAFRLVELPSARAVGDSLLGYLSYLEDPDIPAASGLLAAERLYDSLLAPVEDLLPEAVDHLVIVPDGILFRLPFETLARRRTGFREPECLVDRFTISYAPSASALLYLRDKPEAAYAKEILAFGLSDYRDHRASPGPAGAQSATAILADLYRRQGFVMSPIPHARREIASLAGRVPSGRVDVFFDRRATERAFKGLDLGAYRIIHLACHAFSDDNYPLRSSLVFSPDGEGEEDGFLQASEMYGMRTEADLVVLSACQTGRGKIVRNEGLTGLPRVFFYMGARSVVSTLWPVDDRAAEVFMGLFYDAYFAGAGKAEALRAAKRKMRETKYRHPCYWASFTLTGEI